MAVSSSTLATLLPLFLALALTGQGCTQAGFWRGKVQIYQFNFSYGVAGGDRAIASPSVDLWKYTYDLYQDPAGVAREQLTSMNRNRSVEGPLDVRLMDYGRGYGLIFDKGSPRAVAGPLTRGPGRALGQRTILGFACEGTEYQWKTFQHATVRLESWTARDGSFKVPLLQLEYFLESDGTLLSLTVEVVSEAEPSERMPSSFFEPPRGLRIVRLPSVG
jgi:hypothetical protein